MDVELEAPGGLNLADRIRRLANGRNAIDVAQFQFINLEEIRTRYGAQWPARRERVFQVARHFIARRIAPEDVLIPAAEGFLLVFGTFTGILADAVANRISKELNTYFLGSPDLDDMKVSTQHQLMTIDEFAKAFGDLVSASKDLTAQARRWASPRCGMRGVARWRPTSSLRSILRPDCRWSGTITAIATPTWTS
jgi:hypothetical protein